MKKIAPTMFVVTAMLAGVSNAYASLRWVPASAPSCANTCLGAGMSPIASGTYTSGESLYVCAANAGNEGFRAGFNLKPSWANACIVAWGSGYVSAAAYVCLCQ
jgi:hypothetical protein